MSFLNEMFFNKTPMFLLADFEWIKSYTLWKYPHHKKNFSEADYYQIAYDDFHCSFGIGYLSLVDPIKIKLGNQAWTETKSGVYLRKSIKLMEKDEYPLFIKNPYSFIQRLCLDRLYNEKINNNILSKSFEEFKIEFSEKKNTFTKLNANGKKYFYMGIISAPLDFISDYLRGTKELLVDIHTIPEMVLQACKVVSQLILQQAQSYRKYNDMNYLLLPLHLPGMLNRSDFEKFFYPTYKYILDDLVQNNFKLIILFEGNVNRFIDIISDINSKNVITHFESLEVEIIQEAFKGKKTYISGFYPSYLLKYCGLKECIAYAKNLKKKTMHNDRYIFSTNISLYTDKDIKHENLLGVHEFLNNDDNL
ncbi:MAG: uroporphyrinogen decarboxylase family protein [Eubacteriales bacterium]